MKEFIDLHWDDILSKLFLSKAACRIWMTATNGNFGGASPKHLVENGRADKVRAWLQSAVNGF